jgi:hypothetical protein
MTRPKPRTPSGAVTDTVGAGGGARPARDSTSRHRQNEVGSPACPMGGHGVNPPEVARLSRGVTTMVALSPRLRVVHLTSGRRSPRGNQSIRRRSTRRNPGQVSVSSVPGFPCWPSRSAGVATSESRAWLREFLSQPPPCPRPSEGCLGSWHQGESTGAALAQAG